MNINFINQVESILRSESSEEKLKEIITELLKSNIEEMIIAVIGLQKNYDKLTIVNESYIHKELVSHAMDTLNKMDLPTVQLNKANLNTIKIEYKNVLEKTLKDLVRRKARQKALEDAKTILDSIDFSDHETSLNKLKGCI